MTPHDYIQIEATQNVIIESAQHVISEARNEANKCPPPKEQLRKAVADDLTKIGNIVWHDNGDEGWFWNVVQEPLHYGDNWKAYIADDGCRYGLDGAWVYRDKSGELK